MAYATVRGSVESLAVSIYDYTTLPDLQTGARQPKTPSVSSKDILQIADLTNEYSQFNLLISKKVSRMAAISKHLLLLLGLGFLPTASAVTEHYLNQRDFIHDPAKLNASLSIEVVDQVQRVSANPKILYNRIKRSPSDERVEELRIKVPASPAELTIFSKNLARPKRATRLYDYLSTRVFNSPEKVRSDGTKKIKLTLAGYKLIDPAKLSQLYTKDHHKVTIAAEDLKQNSGLKKRLMSQIEPFLSVAAMRNVRTKLQNNETLNLETDLLPDFARRMVRRFLVYRGPNCFHASLAFHSDQLTRSQFFNVKRENGYHRMMINYDELWRAINRQFYEVDVEKMPLRYGDMLVFFELPEERHDRTYFRWIRHAATYLFGPYTFSKGSKSPDTPYTVKTLEEEWQTWRRYTKNLGVKVFRRTTKNVTKTPPKDLVDWIY